MLFLTPGYLKKGKLYLKEAEKRLAYHRDLWSEQTIADFKATATKLRASMKARDKAGVEGAEAELEKLCEIHCPRRTDSSIGENVEVFLVAIVVALGIRTYFLQPFTIPTASMQPTLFGITGRTTQEEPPNVLKQAFDFAWYGRTWYNAVAEADGEQVIGVEEKTREGLRRFFTYTLITTSDPQGGRHEYWINAAKRNVEEFFGLNAAKTYKKGEPIVRGYTDTGDHVFVDKMSYHFRKPKHGEVFVFDTRELPTIEHVNNPNSNTQYYIKRLVGLPGDELRVEPPKLFVNGELRPEKGYQRVMAGTFDQPKDGYYGYSNRVFSPTGRMFNYLVNPTDLLKVEPGSFWAMGDNSYHSSDSRDWGFVRTKNVMGTGVFVYWPFGRGENRGRWGIIE